MAEAAFNTIAEIQRLRDAGIEQKQAEAITLSIHAGVTGGVATKADLELVRKDVELVRKDVDLVRKDVSGVKTELDGKIDTVTERLDAKIDLLRADVVSGDNALRSEIDLLRKDVEKAEERLDGKIDTGTSTLRSEIASAKFDLTWRLVGAVAVLNGLFLALSRYMATPPAG